MRHISILFFFIAIATIDGVCQDTTTTLRIDHLPADGVVINKGWKFFSGDSADYAKPDFDDSSWKDIDPTKQIDSLSAEVKSGICWLRVPISLADNLKDETLAILITQYLASEIYLNGKLIYKFGKVSTDTKEVRAYRQELPLILPTNGQIDNVLAIRYIALPGFSYYVDGNVQVSLMVIKLYSANDAFAEVKKFNRHLPVTNTFRMGAVVILAFLYLSFFIYNPSRRAYLFFFLYALFMVPGDLLQINLPPDVEGTYLSVLTYYKLWQFSGLFLIVAMYSLLNQKKGWIFWALVVAVIVGLFLNNWVYSTLIVSNLVNLELLRISLKASQLNMRGAWIITAGALVFLVTMGSFAIAAHFKLAYFFIPLGESYIFADVLYGVGSLSIPVATTIYVALDFAFTNQRLGEKLGEVEALSKKTLEQEKEKQQILSSLNTTLEKQVAERTAELNQSLINLKATQAQLLQSEKMASLGELTAGIAHEIQNPLNFVNNFSEVNSELIKDLKSEIQKGNLHAIGSIATDIESNEEKINHHGKRADAIVKNMLQHSRVSSGKRETVDINALCDEYLRLAYHGYRAKEKSFNAKIVTDLDTTLPKATVIPQDIGRVLLNLMNNAFYAVNERLKTESQKNGTAYEPIVTVSTKYRGDKIEICVKDNGIGIADVLKEKIFQPFFTTKPTGQGTGLGLSLAYDVITKGHGGRLLLSPGIEGGSAFIIELPISQSV